MDAHRVFLEGCALANFPVGCRQVVGKGDLWFALLGSPRSRIPSLLEKLWVLKKKEKNRFLVAVITSSTRLLPEPTRDAAASPELSGTPALTTQGN